MDHTSAAADSRAARGQVAVETGPKRVRVHLAGRLVADTRRPLPVSSAPHYPTYYPPRPDLRAALLY